MGPIHSSDRRWCSRSVRCPGCDSGMMTSTWRGIAALGQRRAVERFPDGGDVSVLLGHHAVGACIRWESQPPAILGLAQRIVGLVFAQVMPSSVAMTPISTVSMLNSMLLYWATMALQQWTVVPVDGSQFCRVGCKGRQPRSPAAPPFAVLVRPGLRRAAFLHGRGVRLRWAGRSAR